MSTKRKKKAWSESFGDYGARVRLFEDPRSGIYHIEYRDPNSAPPNYRYRTKSLKHRDLARARRQAKERVRQIEAGLDPDRDIVPTVDRVLAYYKTHHTPSKCDSEQDADERRTQLWTRWLGASRDLSTLRLADWNNFIEARRPGAIDSRGRKIMDPQKRRSVRNGTVIGDLIFLRAVINWACKWQDEDGRYLMVENPTRGFDMPKERNPLRPVATRDRYEAILKKADEITWQVLWGDKPAMVRTYLRELLMIVAGTGRRISAVCQLRFDDLRLDQGGPHGSIRWPADTDKMGKEFVTPINHDVRAALDSILAERPGIAHAPLFPGARDRSQPIRADVASKWLLEAERLAGVPKQKGGLWHPYRRMWASERKHLSVKDVAAAGGWTDVRALQESYQHADEATMYQVVSSPTELRERKRG